MTDMVDATKTASRNARHVGAVAQFVPAWFNNELESKEPNPFTADPDVLAVRNAMKARLLHDRFPDLPLGSANPTPCYSVPQYSCQLVIAAAYGAGDPIWDPEMGALWPADDSNVWASIDSADGFSSVEIPDWGSVRLVREMIEKFEEVKSRRTYALPMPLDLPQTVLHRRDPRSGKTYDMTVFPGFIALGPLLYGPTQFFALLAADPDAARAMLDKCFELSTSCSDYLRGIYGLEVEGLCSFGGDNSCLLSPGQYRDYAMTFDLRLVDKYGNLPVNLHSCGHSKHLYDVWAEYWNLDNIVFVQTRAVPGHTRRLRQNIPDTWLQLTLMPPDFDFEYESPERIRQVVKQLAEEAGWSGIDFTVVITRSDENIERSLRALFQAVQEIREE